MGGRGLCRCRPAEGQVTGSKRKAELVASGRGGAVTDCACRVLRAMNHGGHPITRRPRKAPERGGGAPLSWLPLPRAGDSLRQMYLRHSVLSLESGSLPDVRWERGDALTLAESPFTPAGDELATSRRARRKKKSSRARRFYSAQQEGIGGIPKNPSANANEGGAPRLVCPAGAWLSTTSIGRDRVRWRTVRPTSALLAQRWGDDLCPPRDLVQEQNSAQEWESFGCFSVTDILQFPRVLCPWCLSACVHPQTLKSQDPAAPIVIYQHSAGCGVTEAPKSQHPRATSYQQGARLFVPK